MHRGLKQFLYGAGFLLVVALVALGIYFLFLKPAPTCFDKKQNQNEEGIDCGGPCAYDCALYTIKPIRLGERAGVFYLSRDTSTLVLKIENPNANYGARSFDYEVNIYDQADELLTTLNGESFIYAGEIKYLIFPLISLPSEMISGVKFSSNVPQWARSDEFKRPELLVQNYDTKIEQGGLRVDGNILNRDVVPISSVQILAIFYGKFGQQNGASLTEIDNLEAGEVKHFTIQHPPIIDIDSQRTKIFIFGYRP